MRSVMTHQFSQVPKAKIPRSSFDRSHGYKTTLKSGYLIPVYVDEALPGDTFNLNMTGFARLATPISPFMDNLYMDTHFFAVPIRLVWDNWQKFNGEQDNPGDSTDYLIPTITAPSGGFLRDELEDYFGLPVAIDNITVSSLWHRAYNLIFNEWYRDQNLVQSVPVTKGDGPDTPTNYKLLKRNKRHDYFTSCLPWPQKGDPVTIPTLGNAAVIPDTGLGGTGIPDFFGTDSGTSPTSALSADIANSNVEVDGALDGVLNWNTSGLTADLSTATTATINQLRQAFQIQKMLERDARGGTRYTEIIKSHFGVTSPDARLQRPEYLGGSSSPVYINPIAQTSETTTGGNTPQGNLAAIGTASLQGGHGFTKSFTEHCLLIGIMSIRADLTYQQGINRMFNRSTRYDFYWPALSHIGEQTVLSKELWADGTANDETVFGYQERYAEYRYKPSMITGTMRSDHPQSLDIWHLSQDFATRPTLSQNFIEENPPIDRVIAVTTEPEFIFDSFFNVRCARPMPLYGVPGLIDHF